MKGPIPINFSRAPRTAVRQSLPVSMDAKQHNGIDADKNDDQRIQWVNTLLVEDNPQMKSNAEIMRYAFEHDLA